MILVNHVCQAWYYDRYLMATKPIKPQEIHYPVLQF